jgi:hypothetical protein
MNDQQIDQLLANAERQLASLDGPVDLNLPGIESAPAVDVQNLIATILPVVDSRIAQATQFTPALPGPPGRDGLVTPEEVRAVVQEEVSKIPQPKNGRDGRDGKPGQLLRQIVRSPEYRASAVDYFAGVGGVTRSVEDRLRFEVYAEDYGAIGDGVTDDSAAIQSAINVVSTAGGGRVKFRAKTYLIGSTLTLPSKVVLSGVGSTVSIIKAKASFNADMIKSTNYDSLVGSDTWLVADGNQYAFGLEHIKLDGNKTNQSSGDGVKFYGKRLYINDVIITSVKGEAWHSESNETIPGTPSLNGDDLPEGLIRGLYIWDADGSGFIFRGQHDTVIDSLIVGRCGGWGAKWETSAASDYNGASDIKFAHVYACTSGGITVSAVCRFDHLISESNFGEGLVVTATSGDLSQFGIVQLYGNCRTTGTFNGTIAAAKVTVSNIQIKDDSRAKSGLKVTGNFTTIGAFHAEGQSSTGTGLQIEGQCQRIRGTINGYSGVGATGLLTGSGTQLTNSNIDITANNCTTCWDNASTGSLNRYSIDGFAATGQTFFTGDGPNAADRSEIWHVLGNNEAGSPSRYLSEIRKLSSNIDLNSTTEQSITVDCTELLGLTPEAEDIQATLYYTGSNTTFVIQYIKLHSISSSTITFKVKLSTAAGSAETGQLAVVARL